jgi:heavy metal sensor kinase
VRPRSIRLRITLWYLAILAALLIAFSTAIFFALRRSLTESLTESVETRITVTHPLVTLDADGEPQLDLPEDDPDADDTFRRLYDTSGALVFDGAQQFGADESDPDVIARALEGERSVETTGSGDTEARVITEPAVIDGEIVGALQAGESTEDMRETMRTLLIIIAIALPSALVLASFGGWWLASRALAPIDRITRTASDIGAHDLGRRLDLDLPDDEVGRLARTFDAMIARLDAAFARQRRFTADASHELRTPLTAVRGQIEVALERPRDADEYQRVLHAVNAQVDRMTRLVSGLLMLARTEENALPLQRERVSVRELVESVASQVRPLAEGKGLALIVEPGADATLFADEDLLLQMLLNITDNAVKYTRSGTITVRWRAADGTAELAVIDTGPGIPPEHRERIFERFHRVEADRSEAGSGLGLAICKWIAEAHGGTIRVEEGAASGSRFVVTLPLTA